MPGAFLSVYYNISMADLSIIIISYNTRALTDDCIDSILQSLLKAMFSYEIVVWDNASTDGSQELLRQWAKKDSHVSVHQSRENIGFGPANNMAVKKVKGTHLLFLNSDILTLENAIGDLYEYYTKHTDTLQFLGGKLLNPDMTEQASAGAFFNLRTVFLVLFLGGDRLKITRYSPKSVRQVDWISGACIMVNLRIFESLGGFDEKIFMYMEEVDLLYRARQKDYKTFFYPQSRFIHYGSASSDRTFPVQQLFKGLLYFYRKHYPAYTVFLLTIMLQLKALIAVAIGQAINKDYLKITYGKALKNLKMD